MSPSPDLLPDALLVQRMAALSDRAALLELDARHGMTLYALAYGLLFDGEAGRGGGGGVAGSVAQRGVVRRERRHGGGVAGFSHPGGGGGLTRAPGLGTGDSGLGRETPSPESRTSSPVPTGSPSGNSAGSASR